MGTKDIIVKEVMRIEEDAQHSMKGHYNDADVQSGLNKKFGLPASIILTISGGTALGEQLEIAAVLAFITAILVGAMTFLKPSEKSEQHKSSAARYHSLRNMVRLFRELEVSTNDNVDALKAEIYKYALQLNELNEVCPQISRASYEKAKNDIDEGRAAYRIDEE